MKCTKKLILMGAVLLPSLAWSQQFYLAEGVNDAGTANLYSIDASDCTLTTIGDIGFRVTGLAQDQEGNLYGSEASGFDDSKLIRINAANGAAVEVGSIDPVNNSTSVPDIMFNNGTMYGWSEDIDGVISIDTATGAETVIGGGRNSAGSGFATTPDGTAYVVPCGGCGSNLGEDDSDLFTVNLADGTLTFVTDLVDNTTVGVQSGDSTIAAMTSDDTGELWALASNFQGIGSTTNGELVTIDKVTGAIDTVCTGIPIGADSLSFIDRADDLIFYDGFGLLPFIQ